MFNKIKGPYLGIGMRTILKQLGVTTKIRRLPRCAISSTLHVNLPFNDVDGNSHSTWPLVISAVDMNGDDGSGTRGMGAYSKRLVRKMNPDELCLRSATIRPTFAEADVQAILDVALELDFRTSRDMLAWFQAAMPYIYELHRRNMHAFDENGHHTKHWIGALLAARVRLSEDFNGNEDELMTLLGDVLRQVT